MNELEIDDCHYYQFWDDLISALSNCLLLKVVKIRYMELMGEESGDIYLKFYVNINHNLRYLNILVIPSAEGVAREKRH